MWSDCLVFCDCGFHSVCPLMEKDKRLMEASWWERLRGKLDLVLMGRAMFSKPLIQFLLKGQAMFPPCYLIWGQTMVDEDNGQTMVMKIMATSFKRSHAHTAELSASTLSAGHHRPMPPPVTAGHSQASLSRLLWVTAPSSWVLVGTSFCWCPPRVCFPSLV